MHNVRRQHHFQLDTHSHGPHLQPGGSWGDFWVTAINGLLNLYKREQEIRILEQNLAQQQCFLVILINWFFYILTLNTLQYSSTGPRGWQYRYLMQLLSALILLHVIWYILRSMLNSIPWFLGINCAEMISETGHWKHLEGHLRKNSTW